jgi:uncharacterized membrane protein YebE (DUF533 family)
MGLLDGLVSDLIRSSTGFNARPFVRAVGGKNILLLGGAAIAAALAAEKMSGQGSQGNQVAPPPPPLPPPVPGTEAVVPPPLPLPQESAETALPQDVLFAIVRTLVAGALADGDMHGEEKKLVEKRLGEGGLTAEQTERIRKDLVFPASVEEIASLVKSAEDRELLFRFGALVVLADGEASAPEKTWLESLGRALGLPPERRRALEAEVFTAT